MKISMDYYLILLTIFIIATFLIRCLGDRFKKRKDHRGVVIYRILMGLAFALFYFFYFLHYGFNIFSGQ